VLGEQCSHCLQVKWRVYGSTVGVLGEQVKWRVYGSAVGVLGEQVHTGRHAIMPVSCIHTLSSIDAGVRAIPHQSILPPSLTQ
jgi:hypothetical protein